MKPDEETIISDEMALNYHLMHPGGDSAPGDPNLAYCLDGIYHLHYILHHPWQDGNSFSFVHVTSPDMLHWTWQPTRLQPSFTGHGTFSGTGFITREGMPAAIYAGLSDPRHSYIAVARDRQLSGWEKPYPILPGGGPGGVDLPLTADPDCFLVDDTYYAFSAADDVQLCKSTDLANWTYVGPFMQRDMPDVAIGEDVSCANFFPIGKKWMLLCISHTIGCRYYLGDWDAEAERFVPDAHVRMNWKHPGQSLTDPEYQDYFAPESVLTADGRRVMWTWLRTLDPEIKLKSMQSLPRELSLDGDGSLRIRPLRELEPLRYDEQVFDDVVVTTPEEQHVARIEADAFEVRIAVDRAAAERRRFGFRLFAGGADEGLLVLIRPESGTICLGETEAPFRRRRSSRRRGCRAAHLRRQVSRRGFRQRPSGGIDCPHDLAGRRQGSERIRLLRLGQRPDQDPQNRDLEAQADKPGFSWKHARTASGSPTLPESALPVRPCVEGVRLPAVPPASML